MNKIGLVIPCFNRPEYLKQCLESIAQAYLPDNMLLVLIDDNSTNSTTIELFNSFFISGVNIIKIRNENNKGVRANLITGFDTCFKQGCETVINLDSDAIVKTEFIATLMQFKKQFPEQIITGFNCKTRNKDGKERHPIIEEHNTYLLKKYVGGINMVLDKKLYTKYVLPALQKVGNWDHNTCIACDKDKKPIVCVKPSVVQHIGLQSSMGHTSAEEPDLACDFKSLHLPDVTLFGVDAHDPKGLLRAAEISQMDVDFGAVKIITERLFSGREAYSRFCIKDMVKHIETSHLLIIHPDGYILNWKTWDNTWLQYDYIGATWWYKDGLNVGNGGFSLRSRKLLEIISEMELDNYHPEDDIICRQLRPMLEKQGIRFAPEEVANRFAIEAYNTPDNKYRGQFGFHGYHVSFGGSGIPQSLWPKKPSGVQVKQTISVNNNDNVIRIPGKHRQFLNQGRKI
jgi:glycosyltransferase involved in cell wall biosynthesis